MKRNPIFLAGVSMIAIGGAGYGAPSYAQSTTPPVAQSDEPDDAATTTTKTDSNGNEIVVTGRRAALESADRRKEKAETIIDSVVADDAGKLPDNSITEVLQRVSGVSIVRFAALNDPDHFSVEGSGIQVRGLSGVASRLNGREIFSANSGRSLLWGDVTPELMQAVDVYKASTADLIEGGTGGQIDLRTKMPFDYKGGFHTAATGSLSMGDLAQKADTDGSVLVTDRWHTGIGDIGVLADVAYSSFSSHSDFFRTEPYFRTTIDDTDYFIPGGYDFGNEDFNRKRTGIYGAVQWAPSSSLELYGTFFQSRYKNRSVGHGTFATSQALAVDPSSSEFDDNNGLTYSNSIYLRDTTTFQPATANIVSTLDTGLSKSNTVTRDYSAGFNWTPGDSGLSVKAAAQLVESTAKVASYDVFGQVPFPSTFGLDLRGDLPQVLVAPSQQAVFDTPADYTWYAAQPHNENNRGKLYSGNLDVEYSFRDSDFFKSVKAGARYAERTERDLNNQYAWNAFGQGWTGCNATTGLGCSPTLTFANSRPGDIERYAFNDFFHGGASSPGFFYFPSLSMVSKMDPAGDHADPPAGFCGPETPYYQAPCNGSEGPTPTGYGNSAIRAPGFVLPDDMTNYKTTTWAAYALIRFGRDATADSMGFDGNIGGRIVRTRNASSGFFTQGTTTFVRDGTTYVLANNGVEREGGLTFTRFLPSVNVQLLPTPTIHIRAGYNITMDNASFYALRAQGSLGVSTEANAADPTQPGNFLNFTASTGNPALKPTMSNNVDLSFEWYPKPGTTFHLAPFYKRITDLPIYGITTRDVTVYYTSPTATSEVVQATSTDISNASKAATVKGLEVGGRTFFDMLPGLLSGFGVEANYTYIDSKNPGDRYLDIDGVSHNDVPVQGLSKHNFNATLFYEKNPISARIAYSWRSKYLQSTNSNGTNPTYNYYSGPGAAAQAIQISLPVYGDAYGTLDAGVQFKVTDNFSFSIQGTNLLNSTARTLMGGYPGNKTYIRSWFQSDRRISTGINLAF